MEFRPRHARDKGRRYKSKKPNYMDIGVQRFAVMLPIEEQGTTQEVHDVEQEVAGETGLEEQDDDQNTSEMTLNYE